MKRCIVDTDVIIACLRGYGWALNTLAQMHESGTALAYTPVTAAEIIRGLRKREETPTRAFLAAMECIPLTREVGELAGEYLRSYGKSHGVEIADALIAAAASVSNSTLLTMNRKHYPMKDVVIDLVKKV